MFLQLNLKTVLFQTNQFSLSTLFSSIWPIDRTLSGAPTPGQIGLGSDGNKGVFHITGASASDSLVSYPGHSLRESYSSAEMQLVYSATPRVDMGVMPIKNLVHTPQGSRTGALLPDSVYCHTQVILFRSGRQGLTFLKRVQSVYSWLYQKVIFTNSWLVKKAKEKINLNSILVM